VGVDVACKNLRAGTLSGAVVAGVNLWLSPEHTEERGTMRAAYSASGKCHTFDAKADGYCRAEAVNAVYLKRLSDAVRDGDPIRALIRGTASNSDGWTPGINSPSSEAQAAMIREAYKNAAIDKNHYIETGYLECHGTGTPAGDPLEVKGAASVLAHMRPHTDPLIIGSVKSNIGHSEPGAGLSGLIKAMLAVEEGKIPGNPTFFNPNPAINFDDLRVHATRPGIAWPKESHHYRRASVNSFGFGGSNAHAILDNVDHYLAKHHTFPKLPKSHVSSFINLSDMLSLFDGLQSSKTVTQRPQVLVFSANDMDSLKRQIMTTSAHLLNPRVKVKLSDLSFTLSDRRSRHFCRAFLLGYPTKSGHASKLAIEDAQFSKTPQEEARIGFVFTGQGAQWSKMGAKLVETFPVTSKRVLEELDKALQELPLDIRPEWSLQEELTQARSSERLSQPEFSQPLVTALQLTQLAVLESWNVRAEGVVGHSSGEIAAACSAGFITPRQAILNAYFRGIAGKSVLSTSRKGMMAVGLSAKDVQSYIDDANVFKDDVVIACYNSPASVTISGSASSLAEVEDRVKAAGHFARILRVEVAYHSHHMTEIADRYEKLLIEHGGLEECGKVTPVSKYMISTVTENEVTGSEVCTAAYWKANMLSPVRFDGACTKMIKSNKLSPNFLLELGPSNTLAGPVTQIAKAAKTDQLTYAATNKRGEVDSCRAMFDVAGHLFLQNARFSLGKVNICEGSPNEVKPAVIVDLPNYQWKHSIQYWHESLASKDWRFKKFPAHDLLGSKVLGTLWQSPSWHRLLRLSDVPWLRDHQIGSEILFPAAGYITMAMEAVRQTALSTATTSEYDILKTKNYRYCLRDVQFPRGLVLEDDVEVHVMLLLVPMPKLGQEWWEFKITSLVESSSIASSSSPAPSPEKWKINSSGLVRLELNPGPAFSHATEDIFSLPLNNPTPGQMWYKSMKDAGYAYGPDFQKLVAVESMEGKSRSRSLISLTPPRTKWEPQSEYAVHPAPLDSVLQSMFTSLHRGNRSKLENVLVPRSIGEVTVSSHTWKSGEAVSVTTSSNASGDASLYDPVSGSLIMQLNGLSFTPLLDGRDSVYMSHTYTQLMWKPDFQHLDTDEKLRQAMLGDDNSKPHIQQILDLAAHKAPNLTVLEVNLVPGSTESLWFASDETPRPVRTALTEFHFASNNAENVLSAQERYAEWPAARASRYSVLDPFSKTFTMPAGSSKFDLVVIHWSQDNYSGSLETLAANLRRLISEGGNVVFYDSNLSSSTEDNQMNEGSPFYALQNLGLIKVRQTTSGSCIVAEVAPEEVPSPSNNNKIFVVRFSSAESTIMDDTISQLRAKGWDLDEIHINNQSDGKLSALAPESTVLVLDELARPLLATATGEEWSTVQTIIQRECNLVWVTQGSQITPTTPLNAVAHGVFRTVRAEVPMIRIITLDVESASPGNLGTNAIAINTALLEVNSPKERFIPIEREIVERGGLLYVSRVWPDAGVNKRKVEDNAGGPPSRLTNFHDSKSTISLVTSRPGSLDALHFAEQPKSQVIGPEEVEVELFASGCNARDVDGAMGSVHGDSGKLGLEGAGVVVRVGESVSTRHVGQRVAVFGNGCFSNRVIVSCKTTFTLPDNLSFEDAATLPVAFITGIYALRRLAPVQREDRVLVHSAFTSVGIACVRLCQSSGCDTFVTVSSLEQRQFLAQELALPEDHIFASESTTLLRALHNVTDGHGFDVIISQPMNGNLDYEDGRLLAPGGRLIKITNGGLDTGKLLSTGSLAANCSFQNLDIMALPHNTIES
jgi:acyl transferase domain-containing protein/NADPH:quinone reductase-like Zn-dependent oxidoreductase